jgi:hypothetical protein
LPSPEPDVESSIVGRPGATKARIERVLSAWTILTARIPEAVDVFLPPDSTRLMIDEAWSFFR